MDGERVLFVHAHPDDESIATGGTIAMLAARGAHVTVVTCTRGERGELIAPDLADEPLERVRERELGSALRVLGVHDHRWLGAGDAHLPGTPERHYADSGMQWGADGRAEPLPDPAADSLLEADFADVSADIATVIANARPDAVVSYDDGGGYGHPDHVRAGEAARRAAEVMAVPFWSIAPHGDADLEVDVSAVLDLKREALAGYRSQLVVERDRFAGANGEWEPITSLERFRREGPPEQETAPSRSGGTFSDLGFVEKGIVLIASAVFGGLGGLVITAAHRASIGGFPWAATAGLAIVAALLVGPRVAFASRIPTAVAAAGVVTLSVVLSLPSHGGAVLAQGDPVDYLWWIGAPIIIIAALLWPTGGIHLPGRIGSAPIQEGPPAQ